MLLRDDRQAALNRIETLCLASAADYEAAAEQTHDSALSGDFQALASRHRALAERLAPHIRALGDLPRQPDPDREAFGHVLDGLRTLLAQNESAELVERRLAAENELMDALRAALELPMPEPTRTALHELQSEVEAARALLLQRH